ncbi:MAG: hypothetical protein WC273_06430 [Dehalococcoidia bacterium]
MADVLQLLGATMILVPFAWAQFRTLSTGSVTYLLPNLAGSVLLAWLALEGAQWGFVLLETSWAAVSVRGLVKAALEGRATRA